MKYWERFETFKQRGEYVELLFMAQAALRGFGVCKPWGDSGSYDVGVENGENYMRVQVKSTTFRIGTGYLCRFRPGVGSPPYRPEQMDFFAALVIPEDVWYLIPSRVVLQTKGDLMLCPVKARKYDRYKCEGYREAWSLLGKSRR